MNTKNRLTKLETGATITLPPNLEALIRDLERTPESERDEWWKRRTDAELEAIATSGPEAEGLDFNRLSEEELSFLADDHSEDELSQWWKELRATKPDYFSKVGQ